MPARSASHTKAARLHAPVAFIPHPSSLMRRRSCTGCKTKSARGPARRWPRRCSPSPASSGPLALSPMRARGMAAGSGAARALAPALTSCVLCAWVCVANASTVCADAHVCLQAYARAPARHTLLWSAWPERSARREPHRLCKTPCLDANACMHMCIHLVRACKVCVHTHLHRVHPKSLLGCASSCRCRSCLAALMRHWCGTP